MEREGKEEGGNERNGQEERRKQRKIREEQQDTEGRSINRLTQTGELRPAIIPYTLHKKIIFFKKKVFRPYNPIRI